MDVTLKDPEEQLSDLQKRLDDRIKVGGHEC